MFVAQPNAGERIRRALLCRKWRAQKSVGRRCLEEDLEEVCMVAGLLVVTGLSGAVPRTEFGLTWASGER